MDDAIHQRVKTAVIHGFAGRHRHRAHRPAVESAGETDEIRPPGVVASQLEGRFNRFGAGVGQKGDGRFFHRSDFIQLFGHFNHADMVKIRRDVNELFRLFLNGFDYSGMAVTGGIDRDPGHKIQEFVPVHIPEPGTFAIIHGKGIITRV